MNIQATLASGAGDPGADTVDDAMAGFGVSLCAALLFFVMAQFVWIILLLLYETITVYDDQKEIEEGNIAVGIDYACTILCFGMVSSTAIATSYSVLFFFVYV